MEIGPLHRLPFFRQRESAASLGRADDQAGNKWPPVNPFAFASTFPLSRPHGLPSQVSSQLRDAH